MTFNELLEKYPINSTYRTLIRDIHDDRMYNNATDIKHLREEYDNVELGNNGICICTKTEVINEKVTGYMFTDDTWFILTSESCMYAIDNIEGET